MNVVKLIKVASQIYILHFISSFLISGECIFINKLGCVIRDRVGVAQIEEKLTQHRLRWFGHVQRRPPEAPVRNGVLEWVDNVKRGRGRPKLTWDESVKRDLKNWNISKEIALDRSAWRLAINVPEP